MRPILLSLVCLAATAAGQSVPQFKTRLSPVPMDATMRATVAGSGSVTAALKGTHLEIKGRFEGLITPATVAQLRVSPVTGVRGPAILDLTVTKGVSGEIGGAFDLTAGQVDQLRKGCLYILIDSEKAPDGNLQGWLLP